MSKFKLFFFGLTVLLVDTAIASACVCPTVGQPIDDVRNYYKNEFKGAVFTGKIRTIGDLPYARNKEFSFPMREMVIDIEQYWLGINKPEINVLTIVENTSCTVDWPIGKTIFFIASKYEGRLNVGMCDLSNWRGKYPDQEWADYARAILGEPKSFPKKN